MPDPSRLAYADRVKAARLARRETLARAAKRHHFDPTLYAACEEGKDVYFVSWRRFVRATEPELRETR